MADRKAAQKLLAELPAQDLKALEELAHWHESLGSAEGFKPDERVQRLAMVEEAAQPRLRKLGRDYLAAVRASKGSRAQENLVWMRVHEYWRQAGQAYARGIDARPQPAMVVGAIRALGQQLKWQQLRYGPIDPAVWGMLNRVFAAAEASGNAEARLEFLKVAALGASSPDSLHAAELDLAERVIAELAPAFVMAKAPAAELPYWIDLGQPMAPARSARPAQPGPALRFIGAGGALATLNGMLERAQGRRQIPPELKPGLEDDLDTVLAVLRHLAMYWTPGAPERKHKRHSVQSRLSIAHGFDGVLEALGGSPDDSLSFGQSVATDSWAVDNVSAGGFGAIAPQAKSDWLKVGTLVAVQPDGAANWLIGAVRRVSKVSSQEVRVGVQTLSRAPSISHFLLGNASRAQGVLLPAVQPTGEAAIVMRAGVYPPGENLEATSTDGRQRVYMPQGIAARGEDYEIVRFKEMVREA